MRAAVYSGIGKIECRDVKDPETGENEVLIRVKAASICGTDLKIYRKGHWAIREGEKRILGHEFAGEIVECGRNVKDYKVGMRVGVEPNIGCGKCRLCRSGFISYCNEYNCLGITVDGGFAEYVKINERALSQGNMVPFDNGTGFDEAALTEPLACCFNGLESVRTVPGDVVVIIGAGPIGIFHLQLNKLAGAAKVIVADISDERIRAVEKYHPDILINTKREDILESVMKYTGGRGADVVITACPVAEIQEKAIVMAAKRGRVCLFGGLPKGTHTARIDTNLIHYRGIVVTGTTGSTVAQFERSLNLIVERKIDTKSLISKRFSLTEVENAFKYAESRMGLKTVVEF